MGVLKYYDADTEQWIPLAQTAAVGPTGTDLHYMQAFTGTSVTVNHNLNKRPAVTVYDTSGDVVEGGVNYLSLNSVQLTFSASFSGVVICN